MRSQQHESWNELGEAAKGSMRHPWRPLFRRPSTIDPRLREPVCKMIVPFLTRVADLKDSS